MTVYTRTENKKNFQNKFSFGISKLNKNDDMKNEDLSIKTYFCVKTLEVINNDSNRYNLDQGLLIFYSFNILIQNILNYNSCRE